ncbi:MAG: VOC family protein [Defluviitaleaceae bacterium]|nr:VOC family protein [Defluviitaleaceae bacterium]
MIKSIMGIVFDCPNANNLADFYKKLTGWQKEISSNEWASLRTEQGILLVFQTVENYMPPTWPSENGKQQQMVHIDFKVDNLKEAEELALANGAKKSDVQFFENSTVMFDPAGHPFCLVLE